MRKTWYFIAVRFYKKCSLRAMNIIKKKKKKKKQKRIYLKCIFSLKYNYPPSSRHLRPWHLLVRIKLPVGTQRENDVVSTSMRRDHVASTLIRRHFHFDVVCLLGFRLRTEYPAPCKNVPMRTASAQSDLSIRCPQTESVDTMECLNGEQMSGWDVAHVQDKSAYITETRLYNFDPP